MTTEITIAGRPFRVTYDQPVTDDFTTPYLLTPLRRCAQGNFRLFRSKPDPALLFMVGNNPFSAGGLPQWGWVRETAPGVIVPI
jgi:hypothetical protein